MRSNRIFKIHGLLQVWGIWSIPTSAQVKFEYYNGEGTIYVMIIILSRRVGARILISILLATTILYFICGELQQVHSNYFNCAVYTLLLDKAWYRQTNLIEHLNIMNMAEAQPLTHMRSYDWGSLIITSLFVQGEW